MSDDKGLEPFKARGPSVERIVQEAARDGLVEPELERLPASIANTLRAMIAGERPAPTLSAEEIALLGRVIARWKVPYGRFTLGLGRSAGAVERPAPDTAPPVSMGQALARLQGRSTPGLGAAAAAEQTASDEAPPPPRPPRTTPVAESLIKRLGLPPHKASRVAAVVYWPIGYTYEDLAHWGLLSEEETKAVWEHIVREYGFYMTGTLYAAP